MHKMPTPSHTWEWPLNSFARNNERKKERRGRTERRRRDRRTITSKEEKTQTTTLIGKPKIEVTESCGKLDLKGEMMLWTYLNLQDKPHLLASKLTPPFDLSQSLSPNMLACTGPSARSLDADGMPRPLIVLKKWRLIPTFCGTYCVLILLCLLIY
jgi:hypothetical protein